jgi:hypothetical protein
MLGRKRRIEPGRRDDDGASVRIERSLVRRSVDALRSSRQNRNTRFRER